MKKFEVKKIFITMLAVFSMFLFINQVSNASSDNSKHYRRYKHYHRTHRVKKAPAKKPVVVAKQAAKLVSKPAAKSPVVPVQSSIQPLNNEKLLPAALKPQAKETPSLLSIFSSLITVIGLILFCAWAYLKFNKINPQTLISQKISEANLNKINLLSTTNLGQGKSLHLIEINGKKLVIGSSSNNINLLTEVPSEPKSFVAEDVSKANKESDEVIEIVSKYEAEAPEYEIGADIYKDYLK